MRDLFFTGDRPKSKLNKIKVSATYFGNYLPNKTERGRGGRQAGVCGRRITKGRGGRVEACGRIIMRMRTNRSERGEWV